MGGWLFHNGRTIYRYDLYEDGSFIPDWNWEGNPYKWSITDNGEMLRERERCDFTYDGKEVCFTYQKVYHKKLAEEGEFFYVSREFQQYWLNYDSGIVEFNNSFKSILVYEKSNHYGHTQFSDWAQGRYFYAMSAEDPRASITKVEFTSPGNGSWSYDEVPKDENGYFIVKEYTDTTSNIQFTPYKFSGGSIIFNSFDNDKEMRFSIIAHERDFYTVCHYEVGANIQEIQSCSTGELLYFFDEASTAEAMQGAPLINKQKFIDKKVYNFGSQGGKNTDVTVMEMANDGTVILKEQDGTSFSGKFSFVDNQVISFNVPTEGEDWDTFAVITGYNSEDNIYEYCFVDDEDNITAAMAKKACLAGDVSGTAIDELFYGSFVFDETQAQNLIKRIPHLNEYLLADMFISLDLDSGYVLFGASNKIDIDWSLNDKQIIITPSKTEQLYNDTLTCKDVESGNSYDCATKLAKITIDITSEDVKNPVVNYQVELLNFDINNIYLDKPTGLTNIVSDVTMFATDSTLPILTENMTGKWYIESFLPNSNTALVTFNANGTGHTRVTGDEYNFTWHINGLRLHIDVPSYAYFDNATGDKLTGYNNSFWLTNDNHSLYRNITMRGINGITQARIFDTPTVAGFTFDEAATGWNVEFSHDSTTVYDFHEDGEYFYGWGYSSYNEWRIDNGDILRHRTVCEADFNGCVEQAQVIHRKIAIDGDDIFILRQWQFLNREHFINSGEIQYQLSSSNIVTMTRKDTFGESDFNSNFDDTYSYVVKGHDDMVNESWELISANGWRRDEHNLPNDGLNYIVRDTTGTPTNVTYKYIDGQIAYTENNTSYRIAMMEVARYYAKVCIAEHSVLTADCVNGETMYFYRNSERAEQHAQFRIPSPEARFLIEMVYGKSFSVVTPNNTISGFTFNADGTGYIQTPPNADNNYNNNDISSITWQVSRTGTLTFTETEGDGETWQWTMLASDTSPNATSFIWYSSGRQENGLYGLEKGTGIMTPMP